MPFHPTRGILVKHMETSRQAVEKNLSEIAFASLAEKTPALMDYYLGFDLVEKNDEGTRACGIMGFKIGKQLVYVPIFFLNGKIKGTEVMYLKNSDVFVNNTEQWVNYVIGQSQGDTGEGKEPSKNHPEAGEVAKALALFSRPPASATKTASIEDYSLSTVENFIDKDLLNQPLTMGLVDFIKKAGSEHFKKIAEVLSQEDVWKCVTRIYDPSELMVKFEETKQASAPEVVEDKSVRIIRIEDSVMDDKIASILSPDEKGQIFVDGYIIKNAVEGDEATKTYIEDEKDSFQEVTESGLYNVLNRAGDLIEAFVLVGPVSIDAVNTSRGGSTGKLIIAKGSKNFFGTKGEVFYRTVRESKKVTDKSDRDLLTDGGKGFDSLSVDKTYVLVGDDFSVYGPFEVRDKSREGGRTTVVVRQAYCGCCCGGGYETINLRSIKLEKAKIDRAGNTVYVPDTYKFIEVKESGYYMEDDETDVRPGDFATVVDALSSKGGLKAIFEKSNNDLVASVEDKTASFTNRGDFVFYLCDTMRLPLVTSEKIASKLIDGGRSFQAVFMPKVAGSSPDVIDPNTAYGATRDGTPMETEGTYNQQMIPPNPPQIPATDPSFGSWDQPSSEDMGLLERASNSNSREVFDPAMIGILVRTTRAESIVQEYIPEFVDNLDRMIRLLLLFYWHNAEFADSYGIDEMADFEDLLQSTIKTTGKTILFLKQKSVESSTGATDVLG